MNQFGAEKLKEKGVNWPTPYLFHEDTYLIKQYYIGGNGRWLSLSRETIDRLIRNDASSFDVKYDSHNVDSSKDAHTLLVLFDMWVSYADTIKRI